MVTIITGIIIFLYGSQQVMFIFMQPDYSQQTTTDYIDFTTNTEKLEMYTEYTTIALKLMHNEASPTLDPETLARI